jgi:uncharacterized protein with GYD domain
MAKYLIQGSYTSEGARGLLKDGGSKRRTAVEEAARSVGASVEAFYYGFGDTDAFVIVEAPDHASAAAVSLTVSASGAAAAKTTVLLTPEQIDEATKKSVKYRAPGA